MPRGRPAAGGVNKSEEIRKYYENHPESKTKDCIEFLSDKGIEVSQALVAGVRSRMLGEGGSKKKKGEISVAEVKLLKNFISKSHLEASVATKTLMELACLIEEIGSVERFKDVLSEFGNFSDSSEEDENEDDAVAVGVADEEEDENGEYEDVNDDEDDD
jgi:hypothetical protein